MKISDDTTAARQRDPLLARANQNTSQWMAQLERAWLESWQTPPSADQATARNAGNAAQGDRNVEQAPIASDVARRGAAERPNSAPLERPEVEGQTTWTLGLGGTINPSSVVRAFPANMSVAHRPLSAAPVVRAAPVAEHKAALREQPGGEATREPLVAPGPVGVLDAPPEGGNVTGRSAHILADTDHQTGVGHGPTAQTQPGSLPSRTSLQVAVAQTTAQVTLRDASLAQGDMALTGQAIATQLLGLGVQSVRVYVNGVESNHRARSNAQSAPRQDGVDSTSRKTVPSTHITLERK